MPNLPGRWPLWYPGPGAPLAPFEDLFSELAQSVADTLDGYKLPISVASAAERNALFPSPSTGDRVFRRDLGYVQTYYPVNFFVAGVAAGWQRDGGDSGNLPLSLTSGWSSVGGAPTPSVRVVDGMVSLNGRITAASGAGTNPFILPSGARPSNDRVQSVVRGDTGAVQTVVIGTDGAVYFVDAAPPASDYRLATISPWMKA